jgi:1-acyl-sn-glycerol-3-phosphate acyltransferase
VVDLHKPYVDGLDNLPRDGRFLLVSNHTQTSPEPFLIFYLVRRAIGIRVPPPVILVGWRGQPSRPACSGALPGGVALRFRDGGLRGG